MRKPVPSKRCAVSRPPEIEAEIRRALLKGRGAWLEMASTLKIETVVHLARHLKEPADNRLLGDLLERIVFRAATPIVKANSKTISATDQAEVLRDVFTKITEAVMNGSPLTPDFLEAKFGLKIKQWTIDVVRLHVRRAGKLVPLEPTHETERERTAWRDKENDKRADLFGDRCSALTKEVLSAYPHRVQQAFAQHVYQDIPIESERDGALSIASIHRVSGRAVRLWFAKIREAVKERLEKEQENSHDYE